jgi:hypothetical protein
MINHHQHKIENRDTVEMSAISLSGDTVCAQGRRSVIVSYTYRERHRLERIWIRIARQSSEPSVRSSD